MAKRKKGKDKSQKQDPINYAISYGVQELAKNSLFGENPEFVSKHIDEKLLKQKAEDLYEESQKKGMSGDKQIEYVSQNISDYIVQGHALDEIGQKVVLKKGLETKVGFIDKVKEAFGGKRQDLNKSVHAFRDLYSMLKSGGYAERMPDLTKAAGTIYDMGFMDTAVDVLKAYGFMDDRKYKTLKKAINSRASEETAKASSSIESYIMPQPMQKAAAVIAGMFGVFLLTASGNPITGNVIGNLSNTTSNILGLALVVGALGLFLFRKRR